MAQGPQLFTCPKCRHRYLGHEPLPDCPRCGYDYREREGFRWDVLMYLLAIMGLLSFLLVASYYRGNLGVMSRETAAAPQDGLEKLPGGSPPADSSGTLSPNPDRKPGR
ncbi:MAG: hypothetical protein KGJ14_07760 [Nitrospirota bacterium]|nr:hypothetical protein [Nitrospirota bacterium]